MDKTDLYPRVSRQLERDVKKIKESEKICEENKKNLIDFLTKLKADGISEAQQLSYMARLRPITEFLGETRFKDVTKKEMERVFAEWRSRKDYSQASINKVIQCLKSFYRWLFDLASEDKAPDCVRWLRKSGTTNNLRAEDLWTEDDIRKVISVTRSDMWKTLISLAFESGLRPGELRSLRIGDIVFNNNIARVYCRGKTEKRTGERVVPVIRCFNLLREWVNNHPRKNDPRAWLWTFGDEPLAEENYRIQLKRLAKKTHISKPCHPYCLRHVALTRFYKELPVPVAKKLAGHSGSSLMIDVYCHLGMTDLEDSVRSLNGEPVKKEEQKETICPRCNKMQDIGAMECRFCGYRFSTKSACEMSEYEQGLMKLGKAVIKKAEQNPKIVDMLLEGITDY